MPFSMRLTVLVGVMLASVIAEPQVPPTAPTPPPKLAVKPLMLPRNDPDPKMTHKPVVLDPDAPVPQKPLGWKAPAEPPVQVDMDKAVVPKVVKSDADLAQEEMEKRFTFRPLVIDPKAPLPANAAVKVCPGCPSESAATKTGDKVEAETTHDDVVAAISIDDTVQDDDLNSDLTTRLNELMQKMNMTKAEKKTEQETKNAQSLEALTKKLKEKAPLSELESNLVKQFQAQFELMDEKKKEIKSEEQQLKNETLVLKKEAAKAKVVEKKLVEKAVGEQAERKEEKKDVQEQMNKINDKAAKLAVKAKVIEKEAVNAMANATGVVAAAVAGGNTTAAQSAAKEDLKALALGAKADKLKAEKRQLKQKVKTASGNSTATKAAIAAVEKKEQKAVKEQVEALGEAVKANPTPENEDKLVETLTKTIAKAAEKVSKKVTKIDAKLEKVETKLPASSPVKAAVEKKVSAKLSKVGGQANADLAAVASAAKALPAAVQKKMEQAVKLVKKEVGVATQPLPQTGNKTDTKAALKKEENAAKVLKSLAKAMPKVAVKVEKAIKKAAAKATAKAPAAAAAKPAPAMATAPKTLPKVPAVSAQKVGDDITEINSEMAPATEKIPALVASPESDAEMALAGAKINMYLQNAGKLVTGVKVPPTPTVDFSPKLRTALAQADEALAKLDALFYDGSKKLKAIALRRAKLGEQMTDLGAALPDGDLGAKTSTCCAPHPAPPVLSDLPVFHPAPPAPNFKTPDYKQMNVPTHFIHHVVHVTHTHQYVLPTLPMSQMSTIHQATQIFHVDPAAIRSSPVLVSADDKCAGCNQAPSTTTMVPAGGF